MAVFNGTTWQEFIDAGAKVAGFREIRWKYIQTIEPKDYLLCYLAGVSRFIGILEVLGRPYKSKSRIWKEGVFPCRIDVRVVTALTPETAVPVISLRRKLSIFKNLRTPTGWSVRFRTSPQKWNVGDGEAIVKAIRQAAKKPIARPFDHRLLRRGRLGRYSEAYRPVYSWVEREKDA